MFMLFYFDPRQNYDVMMHALFEYRFLVWYSSHGSNSGIISGSGLPVTVWFARKNSRRHGYIYDDIYN